MSQWLKITLNVLLVHGTVFDSHRKCLITSFMSQCLKIIENVSLYNNASEATFAFFKLTKFK